MALDRGVAVHHLKLFGARKHLDRVATDYDSSFLANYAIDLARAISKAYLDLHVVGAEAGLARQRLALFIAARQVLGIAVRLLGMRLCERM